MRVFSRQLGLLVCAAMLLGSPGLRAQQDTPAPAAKPASPKPAAPQDAKGAVPQDTKPAAPADDNAFPEAQSQAAQKEAIQQERDDRNAARSGSAAPGGDGSSSRDKLKDMDILGEHESRTSNGAGGTVVDPQLSTKDLQVGQQYLAMGNYQGAYDRLREACAVNPANVDAVFYLAEAARKAGHLDESAVNYRIYLEAQPAGPKGKAARKALAQLSGK